MEVKTNVTTDCLLCRGKRESSNGQITCFALPQAASAHDAEDGLRFMQEMIELSSQQQKEQLPPRAVQITSPPFLGRVVLTAGPAQFGTELSKITTGVWLY